MKVLKDISVQGRVVLVRADLNVPIEEGVVKDYNRIMASLPTFNYILEHGGILTIASHLGRPKQYDSAYSLRPLVAELARLLDKKVELLETFDPAYFFDKETVYLYENTRFFSGEISCDIDLSKQIAACCDVMVMDAFATIHRRHASTYGALSEVSTRCVGLLLEKELCYIDRALSQSKRPLLAVIGGAKISSKMGLLDAMVEQVDVLFIAGGMANTFLLAEGVEVGRSLVETDQIEQAKAILSKAQKHGVVLYLPQDFVVENMTHNHANAIRVKNTMLDSDCIYDIGPETSKTLKMLLKTAKTVVWNGPLGWFENALYANGSMQFARDLAACSCDSIIGGGDSVRVVSEAGVTDNMSYISTGGGAFLALLSKSALPVLDCLI